MTNTATNTATRPPNQVAHILPQPNREGVAQLMKEKSEEVQLRGDGERPEMVRPGNLSTPPSFTQRDIIAALHTHGTTTSEASNEQETPRPTVMTGMSTRQSGDQYDSDGYNTEDEDEFDVDFSENFWKNRQQLREQIYKD